MNETMLQIPVGKKDDTNTVYCPLNNVFIVGRSGSGKTTAVRAIVEYLNKTYVEDALKFVFIANYERDYSKYQNGENLWNDKIINEKNDFSQLLNQLTAEAEKRLKTKAKAPAILVVIDDTLFDKYFWELDWYHVQSAIQNLAEQSAQTGIYFILTRQNSDIEPALLQQMPIKIVFNISNYDGWRLLGEYGAEQLSLFKECLVSVNGNIEKLNTLPYEK